MVSSAAIAVAAPTAPSDADVLARMRNGDHGAYVLLYERYVGPARRLARSILHRSCEVDDVVSEVFAASFAAIRRGRGPKDAFGPYVLSSVRRECYRSWRRHGKQRETVTEPADVENVVAAVDHADATECAVLEEAFGSLPDNLRTVLWLTEVEGLSHGEVAMRTASTGPAVAAMAMRARRALAEGYLQAHGGGTEGSLGRECTAARRSLARVVRGTASARQLRHVDEHLAGCHECAHARDQLRVVNQRLRELAPPALVGTLGWSRLLASGFLRGQLSGWLSGPSAAFLAVAGAVTATVALPAAVEQAMPAAAAAMVTAPVEHDAPSAATPASLGAAASAAPTFDLRIVDDAQRDLAPASPTSALAPDLAPWAWAVSAGASALVARSSAPVAPAVAPPVAPATPQPIAPPIVPLPADEPQVAVEAPLSLPVPVPDIEVQIEVEVPELPPMPTGGGLPSLDEVLPGEDALGVTVEIGPGGASVEVDTDVVPEPGPLVDVQIDSDIELPDALEGATDLLDDVGGVLNDAVPLGDGPLGVG